MVPIPKNRLTAVWTLSSISPGDLPATSAKRFGLPWVPPGEGWTGLTGAGLGPTGLTGDGPVVEGAVVVPAPGLGATPGCPGPGRTGPVPGLLGLTGPGSVDPVVAVPSPHVSAVFSGPPQAAIRSVRPSVVACRSATQRGLLDGVGRRPASGVRKLMRGDVTLETVPVKSGGPLRSAPDLRVILDVPESEPTPDNRGQFEPRRYLTPCAAPTSIAQILGCTSPIDSGSQGSRVGAPRGVQAGPRIGSGGSGLGTRPECSIQVS